MYTVYLAGGIASGKSTAARELERLGAVRIDLDQLSREVLEADGPCARELAEAFGPDVLDAAGRPDRAWLATLAFADQESVRRLEQMELPHIYRLLEARLASLEQAGTRCAVVEVPLLDRVVGAGMLGRADEVACVVAPPALRRDRALCRGMSAMDFERRLALQPSDEYLVAHSDTVFHNDGPSERLLGELRDWWDAHELLGWRKGEGHVH